MIDLIMYGSRANLRSLLEARGLITVTNGEVTTAPYFDYCEWAGSGKFMTAKGTYDAQGNELTPPTFLPQTVILARIYTDEDEIAEGDEQWQRSRVAKYIKNNGTPGTMGGLPYYELANVRLLRAQDVFDWLAARGLPGHEWLGGNSL